MHMRRRNCEHARIKRNNRKFKTAESFCSIFGNYLKVLVIWAIFIMLDYFIDFRFEFIWSCWVFIRTVSDFFRYEGLAFAFFFSLIAVTSDLFCYFLVPTTLLYLLGSSIIWIQLVWQAGGAGALTTVGDRGVYGSMVALCFLFVYVEIAVRLRDPKSLPLGIDLCRPFAAHCIGYPVVTLGFNLKSMIVHRFRMRRQRNVGAQNMTYFTLLDEARVLKDCKDYDATFALDETSKSKRPSSADACQALSLQYPRGNTGNHSTNHMSALTAGRERHRKSTTAQQANQQQQYHNNKVDSSPGGVQHQAAKICNSSNLGSEGQVCEEQFLPPALDDLSTEAMPHHSGTLRHLTVCNSAQQQSLARATGEPASPSSGTGTAAAVDFPPPSPSVPTSKHSTPSATALAHPPGDCTSPTAADGVAEGCCQVVPAVSAPDVPSGPAETKARPAAGKGGATNPPPGSKPSSGGKNANKDEYTLKLESDIRGLKSDLQSLRALEMDLRDQVQQLTVAERAYRSEISQAHQESESLQAKLGQLTDRLQADKANTLAAEKRLADEQKQRTALEQQLLQLQQQQKQQVGSSRNKRNAVTAVNHDETASQRQVSRGTLTNLSGIGDPLAVGPGGHWVNDANDTVNNSNNNSSNSTSCGETSCINRIRQLQSELDYCVANGYSTTGVGGGAADGQMGKMSHSSRPANGHPSASKHSTAELAVEQLPQFSTTTAVDKLNSELSSRLACLKEENQRLTDTLKDEDQMKQKLMTAYHSSLKEITVLNATLTKKEYQIVELNMRLDELTPRLCEYVNRMNAPTYPLPSTSCSSLTPSPSSLSSPNATYCLPPTMKSGISGLVDNLFFSSPHLPPTAQQSSSNSNGTPISSEAMFTDSFLHHQHHHQIVSSLCDGKAEVKHPLGVRSGESGVYLSGGDNLSGCTMQSLLASGAVTTNANSGNCGFDAMSQSYFGGRPYKIDNSGSDFRFTTATGGVLNSSNSSSTISGSTTGGSAGHLDYYPYRLLNGGDNGHSPFPLADTVGLGQPDHQQRNHTTHNSLFTNTNTSVNNSRAAHQHNNLGFSSSPLSPASSDNFSVVGRPSMTFHSGGGGGLSSTLGMQSSHDLHISSNHYGGDSHTRHQPAAVGNSMSRFRGVPNQRHQVPISYASEMTTAPGYGAGLAALGLKSSSRQLPIGHSAPVSSPPPSAPPPGLTNSPAVTTATTAHPFDISSSLVGSLFSSLQCCESSLNSDILPLELSSNATGGAEISAQSPMPTLTMTGKSSDRRGMMDPDMSTCDGKMDYPAVGRLLEEDFNGPNSSRVNYYAAQGDNDLPNSAVDAVAANPTKDSAVLSRCQVGAGSGQCDTEGGE